MVMYEVTITRTGNVLIYADTPDEACEKFGAMKLSDIENQGQLTGWQASDIEKMEEVINNE